HLALSHWEASDRIDYEQNILSEISEILGNGMGGMHGMRPYQRRLVVRGNHHNVGFHVASHHAKQGTLAHAASRKNTYTLPLGDRHHAIDGTNAGFQHFVQWCATQRIDGSRLNLTPTFRHDGMAPIERLPKGIEHASYHGFRHRYAQA